MKWIKYIWILIIVYLVCTARTCTEDEDAAAVREEQSIISLKNSVKSVFMSNTLTDKSLRAYEITAEEKLVDFADYLKIVADTTLDSKFRKQAMEMAMALFIPGINTINEWSRDYPAGKLLAPYWSASQLLFQGMDLWAKPEQINVIIPFRWKNDSTYTGNLTFYKKWFSVSGSEQQGNLSGPLIIDIYLTRSLKSFGDQQFSIWDVYLGAIKNVIEPSESVKQ
jgi:hypothetical protein